MAIKPLPKDKSLKEIHDWWNYGINPVTGMRSDDTGVKNEAKKYYRRVEIISHDKKN